MQKHLNTKKLLSMEARMQKNFNEDMESYLSKVKKPPHEEKKKMHEEDEFKEEENEYYSENKSLLQRFLDFIAGTPSEDDVKPEKKNIVEMEPEKHEKNLPKKGFFSSFKNWFSASEDETGVEKKEEQPVFSQDIKEVLKIQNRWLMKLPQKTIKEFKDSEDYKIYKDTLKKYNLIKIKK